MIKKMKSGFTLVELLVSIGILAIVSLAATGLFFSSIKGSTKSEVLIKVKQNGNYALNTISSMIRNSQKVQECLASKLTIINPDGGQTIFQVTNNQISSNSSALTSSDYDVPNLTFTCSEYADQPSIVNISFSLRKDGTQEEYSLQEFNTTISLRDY